MKQEQQPQPTSYQEVQEALRLTEQQTRLTAFGSFYLHFFVCFRRKWRIQPRKWEQEGQVLLSRKAWNLKNGNTA